MKILIFNTFYHPIQVGGAEKSVQFLAEVLLDKGHEPVVVSTAYKDYIDNINGVKVYYVNTNNIYWAYDSKEQNKLIKPIWHIIDSYNIFVESKVSNILKTENPDVVHTNNLTGFSDIVWKIAKQYNKKIVHTLRDYYQLCPKSTMFKDGENCVIQCRLCKLFSIPKKKNSQLVDIVVGVSQFILEKHLTYGYFKNAKIKTNIFNPVPVPSNIEVISSNIIRLGLVGLISKSKGTEFIIENFIKLNNSKLQLHIYGKGETKEYVNYLKNKFVEYKNIYFQGFHKVDEIYRNIDILIISSLWHEPFPRTLIEAMSYGKLVLATNRGGTSEMIYNGKNGYVFDPNKIEDFEDKIKLIVKMYRDSKFEFDLNCFGFDNIIDKYIEVYSH